MNGNTKIRCTVITRAAKPCKSWAIVGSSLTLCEGWWSWQQCGHCIYEVKPGGTWERDLQWAVPASARVGTPAGLQPVHDDRLISAALLSLYGELVLEGVLRTGRGKATVIKGRDPLDGMGF